MRRNLKGAFKLFAIAATAAGLVALAPAEVQARGGGAPGAAGGPAGGNSAAHMSATGTQNTNGPNAADRDSGKNRAADRKSASGAKPSKGVAHAATAGGTPATHASVATHTKGGHVSGTAVGAHRMAGGKAATHMSATGHMNTNGPNAADRDFGRSRAADRRSASGTAHNKSASHVHTVKAHAIQAHEVQSRQSRTIHAHAMPARHHIVRHHAAAAI